MTPLPPLCASCWAMFALCLASFKWLLLMSSPRVSLDVAASTSSTFLMSLLSMASSMSLLILAARNLGASFCSALYFAMASETSVCGPKFSKALCGSMQAKIGTVSLLLVPILTSPFSPLRLLMFLPFDPTTMATLCCGTEATSRTDFWPKTSSKISPIWPSLAVVSCVIVTVNASLALSAEILHFSILCNSITYCAWAGPILTRGAETLTLNMGGE
mmetsp:Transcript_127177/g.406936  ORF Transcript_127177/g.406936 Transcript_127177/m.406936 type:complete len:217 (-) Transcript_127177:1072-1722(-)